MAAKTQDAAGDAGEKYLRAALTPIVNDAMKRAQVRAQMPGLPDSRPFVDAIVRLFEQTPLATPRVQDDSLRAAAQDTWDAFKDFERYPRTVDGDRLNALAALRAALDKPPAAPTGETEEEACEREFVEAVKAEADETRRVYRYLLDRYPGIKDAPVEFVVQETLRAAARVPAPSAPQEPRGESSEGMVAPLVETLHALGYPPIQHAHARAALRAALSSEARDAD